MYYVSRWLSHAHPPLQPVEIPDTLDHTMHIAKTILLDVIDGGRYGVLTDISPDGDTNAIPFRMVTSNDGNTVTLFLNPPPDDNTSDALDRLAVMVARDMGAPSAQADTVIVPALPAAEEPT